MNGNIHLRGGTSPEPGELGVDEKSSDSWASGRPPSGGSVRFEPQAPAAETAVASHSPSADGDVPADIVFIVKADGTILYLNRTVQGASDGGFQGTSVYSYIGAEYHGPMTAALDLVFETGEVSGYECGGVEPFVEGACYQCRIAPNVREGKVVSATIIARDITRWKRREDELQQQQADLRSELGKVKGDLESLTNTLAERECRQHELNRFRRLIDQAGEAIFITDPDTGRFVDANETACQWLGFSRDKLLTLGVGDLDIEFPLQSPNDVADHVTDTRTADRPLIFGDGTHRRRNGTCFPVEVAIARRMFGDREYQLVVAREIKERHRAERAFRESEVKYRNLFELSRDAIYLSARDGSVADVNDAAIDLFGYTRGEFLGMEARKLYVRSEDIRTFQSGVAEAGVVRDLEVECRGKHGHVFKGLLTATLRRDGEGGILGYQCMIRIGAPSDEDAAPVPEEPVAEPVSPSMSAVLVVDGDKHILAETRTVLENAGISVVTARTMASGAEVLRSQHGAIGTVLLGIGSGEESPLQAVDDLKAIHPDVHVVVMGEETELAGIREVAAAGRLSVVPKPIHPLALIQHVRDLPAWPES
jgi:PAS domain S-box-containing protein